MNRKISRQSIVTAKHRAKVLDKRIYFILIAIFAFLGAWILNQSKAASPTASAVCGATVANYTYQVPFGNAVWNQPVCNLPRYAQSADYASRFYKWANLNDGSATAQQQSNGKLLTGVGYGSLQNNFSQVIYYAKDATTTIKIHAATWDSNLDGVGYNDQPLLASPGKLSKNPDTPVPWNPNWQASQGGDNQMTIVDEAHGKVYEIFGLKTDLAALTQCGFYADGKLCTYTVQVGRDLDGNVVDYRTYEGVLPRRGVGLSTLAGTVTPEEVQAGEIRHSLGVAIPSTAVGPECTASQRGTTAEGNTCGIAVAPATQFERGGATSASYLTGMSPPLAALYTQDKLIPEGMRFALDMSYDQIENWLNSRTDLTGERKNTARIFARALRDYGLMISDTDGAPAGVQIAGVINPDARAKWQNLGMTEGNDINLLDGLITPTNLYVVDPPTVTCKDGTTSKYYCLWKTASYSGAVTPPKDTEAPVLTITSPVNNAVITGSATTSVDATDNVGVTKVEFKVDNVSKVILTTAPYNFSLDSSTLSNAAHTITVIASDAAQNSTSKSVTFTVNNGTVPPAVIGDFNGDGKVTIVDLSMLLSNYGKTVTKYGLGDCDGNGNVNITDLSILLSKYGK